MGLRMSEQEYAEFLQRNKRRSSTMGNTNNAGAEAPAKRSKYGNRRTEADGMKFDSQHEAEVYRQLTLAARGGEYCAVLRQVPFQLPGGIKYIADFVTLELDRSYTVWDAKSAATAKDKVYRMKKRLMKECLGIEIQEI